MKVKLLCNKSHTYFSVTDHDIIISRKKSSSIPNILGYNKLFYNWEKFDIAVPYKIGISIFGHFYSSFIIIIAIICWGF